jgi:signal peptidase I
VPVRGEPVVRTVVEFLICVLIVLLITRTWIVEPRIVPSGSMAATLLGPHRVFTCPHCGYPFRCDSRYGDPPSSAICPNCGGIVDSQHASFVSEGDRLLVFKQGFRWREPERFETAVFHRPGQAEQAYVKRIVGLPGETVSLEHGDLYVDGKLVRKTLRQQRALAVPVNDGEFVDHTLPPRWRSRATDTRWYLAGDTYSWKPSESPPEGREPGDWLVYHQEVRDEASPGHVRAELIRDGLPFNQVRHGRDNRSSPFVPDVLASFSMQLAGAGQLWIKAGDGREWFQARLDLAANPATYEVLHQGWPNAEGLIPEAVVDALSKTRETPVLVEVSTFDRQLLLAIAGVEVFPPRGFQFEQPPSESEATSQPLAIAVQGMHLDVIHPRIFRDVYYTDPTGRWAGEAGGLWDARTTATLGADEYFMLGDNSAYSEDSRLWAEGPAVPARLLIGQPIVVHLPSRWTEWSGRRFQVPDFARMRYIR